MNPEEPRRGGIPGQAAFKPDEGYLRGGGASAHHEEGDEPSQPWLSWFIYHHLNCCANLGSVHFVQNRHHRSINRSFRLRGLLFQHARLIYTGYRLGLGTGTNPRYKRFLSLNVVINRVITDFKHYIRVITDFTPRYNRFFALYPINYTVKKLGPS